MSKIEQFYDGAVAREWERLDRHRMEFAITRRALAEHLPPPPAVILDIGGGPGRYAIALAGQGYAVTLLDLSQGLLDWARGKAAEAGVAVADYVHGNALDLGRFPAATFDAALLMGPLYHLLQAEDRARAVREAARVLKPGGLVFASFIVRYAAVRWGAKFAAERILEWRAREEGVLTTGHNVTEGGFTDSYFAHPAEIRPLMEGGGFETLDLLACEGVISMLEDEINPLQGEAWDAWVALNYRVCRDPSIHGAAEHLLYVGRKPIRPA